MTSISLWKCRRCVIISFHIISLAIPDDAPVLEDSDNEDEDIQMQSDKRITSMFGF